MEEKDKKEELKPSATEMLTGEKPKPKQQEPIDTETPAEEVLNMKESKEEIVEDEILRLIFNKDKLSMTTDINRKTAVVMARAEMISKEFNCPDLSKFSDFIKEHLVSNKRLGRKELIDVAGSYKDDMGGMGIEEMTPKEKIWGSK